MDLTERLGQSVIEYEEALKTRNGRIGKWHKEIKARILKILTNITNKIKMDWFIHQDETIECVYLSFGQSAYGVNRKGETITKVGGSLGYTLSMSGKIIVIIRDPSFANEQKSNIEIVDTYDPEEIDEETVYTHVNDFLSKMTEWENSIMEPVPLANKK